MLDQIVDTDALGSGSPSVASLNEDLALRASTSRPDVDLTIAIARSKRVSPRLMAYAEIMAEKLCCVDST